MSPPCPPWAWWPRPWWRSRWPGRRCGSSAATRWARCGAIATPIWRPSGSRYPRSVRGMAEHVFIVGMMGSGKTTIGRLLAERLGWRHLDSDEQVGRDTGQTVPEIFAQRGEPAFRAAEARALAAAAVADTPTVVSVEIGRAHV